MGRIFLPLIAVVLCTAGILPASGPRTVGILPALSLPMTASFRLNLSPNPSPPPPRPAKATAPGRRRGGPDAGRLPAVQGGLAPFEFPTVGGGTVAWKPGRVTVINAIALWCDTWKEQRQRFETARSRSKGLPVDFLTVSIDGRWQESAEGQGENSILLDQEGLLKRTFDLDRIPMTLLLDTEGKLAWSQSGVVRSDDLVRAIQRVIEDPLPRSGGGGLGRGPVLYLTFDDFPAPSGDDELLDILRREDVPATLFCIGRNVSGNGDVLERALREGHGLGIHSWNHDAKTPEIERCRKALEQLGASADLYRPPGSTRIERLDGTPVTKTALDPSDYRRPGEKELLRRLKSGLAPGKVIQLHAGVLETLHVLPEFIRFAREKGYRFQRLAPEADKSKVMVPSRSVRKAWMFRRSSRDSTSGLG